tara:strand:- start:133 stop:486 length:354 start_codon:yes stop_codon:yes gene_type:complete
MLLAYFKKMKKEESRRSYLKYHFGAILFFAIVYWLEDTYSEYIIKVPDTHKTGKKREYSNNFLDWIWFSAITQTTVGYGMLSNEGKATTFDKLTDNVFKTINFLQICSIIILTSLLF